MIQRWARVAAAAVAIVLCLPAISGASGGSAPWLTRRGVVSIDRRSGPCPRELPPTTARAKELIETFLEIRQFALFDGITACRRSLFLQPNGREDGFTGLWNVFGTPRRVVSIHELPCEFECTSKDRLIRAVVEMRRVDGARYTNRLEFETTGRDRNIWSFLTELTDDSTQLVRPGDRVPSPGPGAVADSYDHLPEDACFANFGHKLLEPARAKPGGKGPAENAVVIVDCATPHTWRVARTIDLVDLVSCNQEYAHCTIDESSAMKRIRETCDVLGSPWWGRYSFVEISIEPFANAACAVADGASRHQSRSDRFVPGGP